MEAHVVRDGAIQSGEVAVADLRSTVSGLDDGAWVWVDAVDPDDDGVAEIQRQLDLHDLAVEDVRHRNQRPKLDLYPGHAFAVFRPLALGPDGLAGSELFVFASPRFLVTLRFAPAFDLQKAKQRWPIVCRLAPGTASALYAIADEIVDDYLEVVEQLEDGADELESRVFRSDPESRTPKAGPALQLEILRLRRDAVQLRRHAVPMRQLIDRLADDSELVTAPLVPYLRDITDHLLRTIELTDGVREILTTVVDIRMAQSAHQLNEVMKKLTAWAAIILVPTLVAGIYGMNFRHMPELHWVVGYPLALALMAVSSAWLFLGFRKRGWL
jgi:magnesium transporter